MKMPKLFSVLLSAVLIVIIVQVNSLPTDSDSYDGLYEPIDERAAYLNFQRTPNKRYIRFGKRNGVEEDGFRGGRSYIRFG
ncbi:unnamed protein product [Heterobilharzia americana]|nr:unnamed protein product [Heterobilharzia americana]CAH8486179.1 unnamed protein product [Heterobilharzia americana]